MTSSTAPSEQRDRINFLLDFENWCLTYPRWDARVGLPRGKSRHLDPLWRAVLMDHLDDYPRQTWEDYVNFCESGHGDEWFQMDEAEENEIVRTWRCTCEDPDCNTLVNGETAGDLHRGRPPFCPRSENESCSGGSPDNSVGGRRVRARAA